MNEFDPDHDSWTNRWIPKLASPAVDLHQRKSWDTLATADQSAGAEPVEGLDALALEVAVAGADLPFGNFALPDESPVHLPHNYEPNYAYPLIVWLNDNEWTARELLDLMPRISPQNYLGLSIEGLTPTNRFASGPLAPPGSSDPIEAMLETLKDVAIQMRREFHCHSERIYLAGFGDQATVALRMMLRRPEWFAGALVFGARNLKLDPISASHDELCDKRVYLAAGVRDLHASLPEHTAAGRLLHTAGVRVVMRAYDAGNEPTPKLFKDIDQWLMGGVYESTLV